MTSPAVLSFTLHEILAIAQIVSALGVVPLLWAVSLLLVIRRELRRLAALASDELTWRESHMRRVARIEQQLDLLEKIAFTKGP